MYTYIESRSWFWQVPTSNNVLNDAAAKDIQASYAQQKTSRLHMPNKKPTFNVGCMRARARMQRPRDLHRAANGLQVRHTSHVTRHTSHVTRHTSHVTRHTSHVTRHTSHVTSHTSHVTRHTSHVTRHMSHVTCHTSHVTRHTSHVTRHTSHVRLLRPTSSSCMYIPVTPVRRHLLVNLSCPGRAGIALRCTSPAPPASR